MELHHMWQSHDPTQPVENSNEMMDGFLYNTRAGVKYIYIFRNQISNVMKLITVVYLLCKTCRLK